jgi:hypothetical protein
MGSPTIGRVRSGSGKSIEVAWSNSDRKVYVAWAGWTYVGEASSASDAMHKAEAWLYNK